VSAGSLSVVAGGRAVGGWETLWEREAWAFEELPHADLDPEQHGVLRFDRIAQPWMREAAKRWARARLLRATSPATLRVYLGDLSLFSGWVAERAPEVCSPALINRALLEDYLLWVRTGDRSASTGRRYVCVVRQFLAEQCDDGLVGLPRGAVIHRSEMPDVAYRPPRGLERGVFEQFIDPANLALLGNEQQRTVILLLAHTGLRVSSVVTLARDALEIGSDSHPYLRYLNVKLKREAMIPIGPVLAEQIRRQQCYLDAAYGLEGTRFLLPSPPPGQVGSIPGRGGGCHISTHTVGRIVSKYVRRAEIHGSDGQLATSVHPHLFRHHLGASLVNDGVALPVIQRVLDHESIEMTARYAQVADHTVERELAHWRERVNIRGERIALPVDGPVAQAAWMKDRISRAKQALPNGYCGLPLVQTCPHPNACLSCDHFLTDPSYREIHEDQLTQTRRLRADAEHGGRVRLVELLEGDEAALTRILAGLDELEADTSPGDPQTDLIEITQESS
jgi:site-specific recombinase XerD